jgi:hypothetical protein
MEVEQPAKMAKQAMQARAEAIFFMAKKGSELTQ